MVFLFCLLFIVRPLIHRVTSQLRELNVKSRRLAEGKSISLEHDVDSHNEVGQLAASFYQMARSISSQHAELSAKNQEMEHNQEVLKQKQNELERALK